MVDGKRTQNASWRMGRETFVRNMEVGSDVGVEVAGGQVVVLG